VAKAEVSTSDKPPSIDAKAEALAAHEDPNAYRVEIDAFEGPLDLLLHLIQKHELDILDIPIGFIAKKYVEYIRVMEELSIDVASDYLVMAATLAHIKSKSLLPPDPNAEEDELPEEEDDPRAELVRRLLEYQKYKQAAEQLGGRSVLGRDIFPRGASIEASTDPAPLAPLSLFKLVDAFEVVLRRAKRVEDHEIDLERITISERIGQISDKLREHGPMSFMDLFENDSTRVEMIVTFLALLEMTKLRMTFLRQDDPMGELLVELRVQDDEPENPEYSWDSEDEAEHAGDDGDSSEEDVLARRSDDALGELEADEADEADDRAEDQDPAEQVLVDQEPGDDAEPAVTVDELAERGAVDELADDARADDGPAERAAADDAPASDPEVAPAAIAEAHAEPPRESFSERRRDAAPVEADPTLLGEATIEAGHEVPNEAENETVREVIRADVVEPRSERPPTEDAVEPPAEPNQQLHEDPS
jgi:segregation and condensation protein A